MVRIVNYSERIADSGNSFFTLEIQGGVEMIKSKKTGNFYATIRQLSIPTTFDGETCKSLIGKELEGSIQKVSCEPYDYTIKETGEVLVLSHKYVYVPKGENTELTTPDFIKAEIESFSQNGSLENVE